MILLVDGNSIAWRAYHASGELSHGGEATGAAFVFLRMLRSAAAEVNAGSVQVAWDGGVPAFRLKALPTYKQRRKDFSQTEEEAARRNIWKQQITWLQDDVLPFLGVEQLKAVGWEADDLLAFWASSLRTRNAAIYSGDRDLWQLVSSLVSVIYPDKEIITIDNFSSVAKGLETPDQWLLFRILTGDGSDGIPGVGGVGEKRGLVLAQASTGIENWWMAAEEIYGRDWLEERRLAFYRNRTLMDLKVAVGAFKRELAGAKRTEDVVKRFAPYKDLNRVSAQLEEKGMVSLISHFTDWSEPFRRLCL